jgi:predicted transcriptional regulator
MNTPNKVQVNVGSLADMGKRFAGAWNRAAAGELVQDTHVTFLDVQTMLDTLSTRRLELLRHVRQHGDANICELAAPWDELQANESLMAA